ncbi:MAG: hypothetical protein GY909_15750 [Oligoflexia bacterium]|nr:hypothetical protein [Oligoflexia bacterium]
MKKCFLLILGLFMSLSVLADAQVYTNSVSAVDPYSSEVGIDTIELDAMVNPVAVTGFDIILNDQVQTLGTIDLADQAFNANLAQVQSDAVSDASCSSALSATGHPDAGEAVVTLEHGDNWEDEGFGTNTKCTITKNGSGDPVVRMSIGVPLRIENYVGPDALISLRSSGVVITYLGKDSMTVQAYPGIGVDLDGSGNHTTLRYVGVEFEWLMSDLQNPANSGQLVDTSVDMDFEYMPRVNTLFQMATDNSANLASFVP